MDSFRKWFYRPRRDDNSLLAQFYFADEELNLVASELDTFDGRKDPERCTALVNQLRHCQDKVVSLCMAMMDSEIPAERANRDFRVKFPDDVMQENLAGQLWFGAECLAAGSSILNREAESSKMRPLAKAVTKTIETVRNLLREQCLKPVPEYTEKIREHLKIFDRLFSEFELSYVSAMVPVKSPDEHDVLQCVVVLFSETLHRALCVELISQDQVDECDPALMFTIPRLAIVAGLVLFPDGPLNLDSPTSNRSLSHLFRPFKNLLSKIRELLWTMSDEELAALEQSLCSLDEPLHSSLSMLGEVTSTTNDQKQMLSSIAEQHDTYIPGKQEEDKPTHDNEQQTPLPSAEHDRTYSNTAYTCNFIQAFLSQHPECRTLAADTNLLPQPEKRSSGSSSSRERSKRDRDCHRHGNSHRSGTSRSSSSRTRLRQERLSDRFLAKLTGVEERPKSRRRSKKNSPSTGGDRRSGGGSGISGVGTISSSAAGGYLSNNNAGSESGAEMALRMAEVGQALDSGRRGNNNRQSHPSAEGGDPFYRRRREYLAQFSTTEPTQQYWIEYERRRYEMMQERQRQNGNNDPGTIEQTSHLQNYRGDISLDSSHRDNVPPPLPPRASPPPPLPPRTAPPQYLPLPPPSHNDSDDSDAGAPPPTYHRSHRTSSKHHKRNTSYEFYKSQHEEERQRRQAPVHGAELADHNRKHSRSSHDNNGGPVMRTVPSGMDQQEEQVSVGTRVQHTSTKDINSIDCSCGPVASQRGGTPVEDNSDKTACSYHNYKKYSHQNMPHREGHEDLDGSDYSTPVNIGECVSSAVAADPSIIGPHNLYQHQDMPAPSQYSGQSFLDSSLLSPTSDTSSASLNYRRINNNSVSPSNNNNYPTSTIIEEEDEGHHSLSLAAAGAPGAMQPSSVPKLSPAIISSSSAAADLTAPQVDSTGVTSSSNSEAFDARDDKVKKQVIERVSNDNIEGDSVVEGRLTPTDKVDDVEERLTPSDNLDDERVRKGTSDGRQGSSGGGGVEGSSGGREGEDVLKMREDVGESSSSSESSSDGGVMSDDELNDDEVALALQAAEVAAAWRVRARFTDSRDLIQRLFVCISGVADQLQTNYASDLRRILKTVFVLNQTQTEEDTEEQSLLQEKKNTCTSSEHDGHSTSNDSESLSVESAEDALAGIGSSQPSSPSHGRLLTQLMDSSSDGPQAPPSHQLPSPAEGVMPPSVCVSPTVFQDHSLLQFSEVTPQSTGRVGGAHSSGGECSSPSSSSSSSVEPAEAVTAVDSTHDATDHRRTLASAGANSASRRSGVEEPPQWVPDNDAPRCMACGAAFTVLRRRHHCRNCGKVFCGTCSQNSVPLTHYGIWKPVRVCNKCFLDYVTNAAAASS